MRTHSVFLPFKRLIHLKGIVHPNIVLNKKYILKNVDDQTVLDPIHLHCIFLMVDVNQWERKSSVFP